jgi:Spy/CpxP family protein refolding chaperone
LKGTENEDENTRNQHTSAGGRIDSTGNGRRTRTTRPSWWTRTRGFGGHPGMGQGDIGQFILGRMGDRLELTEEQRTEIKGIFEDSKEDRQALRATVQEAMKALHEAAQDGTEAEIIAAGKALGDAHTNQALQKSATMKSVKAVLTDEQVAQLDEIKAEMRTKSKPR